MLREYNPPFDARFYPSPVPNAGLFDSPTIKLCVNSEWVSHLDGLLERLLWADAWRGTDEQIEDAIQQIQLLLSHLSDLGECETMATLPVGTVAAYAAEIAPTGWLICDGDTVSRATYADLFAVIGVTFGAGDGSTTFALPDMRQRAIIGYPSLIDVGAPELGDAVGEETHVLTVGEMPIHNHGVGTTRRLISQSGGGSALAGGGALSFVNMDNAGNGQPHNNVPPSIYLSWMIYAGGA